MKEFDNQVKQKATALAEKRELDIQRKFRVQYQKQSQRFEQEIKDKYERELGMIKKKLQEEIAEMSRLRSAE